MAFDASEAASTHQVWTKTHQALADQRPLVTRQSVFILPTAISPGQQIMAGTDPDGVFEGRLKKLRNNDVDKHEEEEDDESPAAELSVQARVDSVALAKGRLSSGAGSSGNKDRLEGDKDRKTLPPSGAKSRLGSTEKDKKEAGGFKGVTRKLRSSLGFGDKEKAEGEGKPPPDLSSHVSFNERVEELPTPGGTQ